MSQATSNIARLSMMMSQMNCARASSNSRTPAKIEPVASKSPAR